MAVQDVFSITDVGVAVTGIVAGGLVRVDEEVCLRPAQGEPRELTVRRILDIRGGRQPVDSAEPGTIVALVFEDIDSDEAAAGDALTAKCP